MDEGFTNDIRENGSGGVHMGVIPPYPYVSLLLANESPQTSANTLASAVNST